MPVSATRQLAYPGGSLRSPEWLAIRNAILHREVNACQRCRLPNRRWIARGIGEDKGTFMYRDEEVIVAGRDGDVVGFSYLGVYLEDTGVYIDEGMEPFFEFEKTIQIILTIAHLDHDPRNNDPDNLAALCQLHHCRYDAKVRGERRRNYQNLDMFLDQRSAV